MINKVILVGRLGRDPELRYTTNGHVKVEFSVATNETWTNKDGQREERTEWHNVVAWGKLAEICGEYLKKGRQVYIEGKLQTHSYEDRDGIKRWRTEIVIPQYNGEVKFLGRGNGNHSDSDSSQEELDPKVDLNEEENVFPF